MALELEVLFELVPGVFRVFILKSELQLVGEEKARAILILREHL